MAPSQISLSEPGPTFDELLDKLEDRDIDVLTDFFKPLSVEEGDTIFEGNQPANSFYILRKGEVQISKSLDPGTEEPTPLVKLGEGNLLGEMSFITDDNRSSTAVATRDTDLYEVERSGFEQLLKNHPAVAFKIYDAILRVLAYRLRRTDEKLVELARNSDVDLLPPEGP